MYFVEKTKGINLLKHFDYYLFSAVLMLSGVGILALSSAVRSMQNSSILKTQLFSLVLGIIAALVISTMDYKDFKTLGVIIYIVSVILLILVLFFGTGQESVGTNGWFNIGGISFQPSEIAKISVIVVISIFFERIKEGQEDIKKNIIKLTVYTLIPLALVLKQPDMGTGMVFVSIFAAMVFICGIPYKYIFMTVGAFLLSSPFLWFFVLEEHQKNRFISFIEPERYSQGIGFNVVRSKLAVGSGQIFGQGLYKGVQTQSNGVPVKESDFIFSVIGEEFGFVGSVFVLILVFFILMRCIYIARNSRDFYGSFLVIGITSMLGFHFIENIGACIGALPVTGIPLPFVSAGGSAMLTNYIAIGIVLSVSIRRKRPIFNADQ
jgi:rod shape determining protein RodA